MAVLLPMFVAWILGSFIFRQRVRGAYFAILTQALAVAFVTLLVGQQGLTGGTNGLTNVRELLGLNLRDSGDRHVLYLIVVGILGVVFLIARQLVNSRYGRLLVAVRDGEDRVRFLGYDPAKVKTFCVRGLAGMAGLAGALFVPVVGIISPAPSRCRAIDRDGHLGRRRRPRHDLRRGARRRRGQLGEDESFRALSVGVALLPRRAVRHRDDVRTSRHRRPAHHCQPPPSRTSGPVSTGATGCPPEHRSATTEVIDRAEVVA